MPREMKAGSFALVLIFITIAWFLGDSNAQQRRVQNLLSVASKTRRSPSASPQWNDRDRIERAPVTEKPLFSPRQKFLKFDLPPYYTPFQIPSRVAAKMNEIASDELTNEFGALMYAVNVGIRIRVINSVDEMNQEITFTAELTAQWEDYVIQKWTLEKANITSDEVYRAHDEMERSFDPGLLKHLWKPDLFLENVVKVQQPELMGAPEYVTFNEVTGKIVYGSRLRIKMDCGMDFHSYPADTQTCTVALRSSNYQIKDLRFYWANTYDAVTLDDCEESNYFVKLANVDHTVRVSAFVDGKTREFDVLHFDILARRKMSYHIVQTFLPSVFFILITWLCFLIPSRMIEARIGISMTTLLTLTAMFASVRESTPIVSYVRAIDIWMLACIFFVFLTLLEFTVVLWLKNLKEEIEELDAKIQANAIDEELNTIVVATGSEEVDVELRPLNTNPKVRSSADSRCPSMTKSFMQKRRRRMMVQNDIAEFLENHSFLIFSIIFTIFNAVFWPWLLVSSGYFDWEVDRKINCPKIPFTPENMDAFLNQ